MSSVSSRSSAAHEGEVVHGLAVLAVARGVADALGDLGHRHASGGEVLHEGRVDTGLAGQAVDALGARGR